MLKKVNRQVLKRKLYRQKLNAGAISKVRTLMKSYLFWVSGFPIGLTDEGKVDWVVAPNINHVPAEQVQLDGQHLSRAAHTVKRLCRDFPRALPEVVGNVDQWKEGMFRLFKLLKSPVHQGTCLASQLYQIKGIYSPAIADKAAEIVKKHRVLKPLIDACSWVYCPAPGDFNFFSVFANAADINKRVLYARDTKGKVVGRCLLALTEEGGIITFHPYTHDETLRFAEMIRDFVEDLAAKMNTIVVPEGHVQKLVANKWYDDGPEDLTKRFTFLKAGSRFRKRLAVIEPENFVSEIQQAFAPLPINEMTLPLVINLKELEKQPRLVVPLLPYIESCRSLRQETLLKAALLLKEAGEIQKAKRLFGWQAEEYVWKVYRETEWIDVEAMKLLLYVDPAKVLSILRKTRPKAVRNWHDEDDGNRLYLAALAHEALQRPKQAALLFRIAAREIYSREDQRECLKRAKKLET